MKADENVQRLWRSWAARDYVRGVRLAVASSRCMLPVATLRSLANPDDLGEMTEEQLRTQVSALAACMRAFLDAVPDAPNDAVFDVEMTLDVHRWPPEEGEED